MIIKVADEETFDALSWHAELSTGYRFCNKGCWNCNKAESLKLKAESLCVQLI
jgi:hypothetical protein